MNQQDILNWFDRVKTFQKFLNDDWFQNLELLDGFSDEKQHIQGSLLVSVTKEFSKLQKMLPI